MNARKSIQISGVLVMILVCSIMIAAWSISTTTAQYAELGDGGKAARVRHLKAVTPGAVS
jgi:hypothetical protein